MIKWPDIKYGDPTPEGKAMDDSWNSCRAACIEAEKSGRMSVEKLLKDIKDTFLEMLREGRGISERNYYYSSKRMDEEMLKYATIAARNYKARVTALLYGDSQPDKQKAGNK